MYIIELFIKWINKNKRGNGANPEGILKETRRINGKERTETDEALYCKHNFMPVDSTGNVLACTKCGFVVKRNSNKNR